MFSTSSKRQTEKKLIQIRVKKKKKQAKRKGPGTGGQILEFLIFTFIIQFTSILS